MDYDDMTTLMKPLIDNYLDHYHLNETTGLVNPTCEAKSQDLWQYELMKPVPANVFTRREKVIY